MIGAVVFLIIFVLFVLLSLIGISIPPANIITTQLMPEINQTQYAQFTEGVINGVIFGLVVWITFSLIKRAFDKKQKNKKILTIVENGPDLQTEIFSQPSTNSPPIIEIEGIEKKYAHKLNNVGIKTTDDLLTAGATKQKRKELSNKTQISEKIILEWVNYSDLFRINGIGAEYSDLLYQTGVKTVIQLARRNPNNLHQILIGVNQAKNKVQRPPSLNEIKNWIEQANNLERKVQY